MQAPAPGWFDTMVSVASVVNTLALLALAVVVVPMAWSFRRTLRSFRVFLDQTAEQLRPLSQSANRVAADVADISGAIRDDVAQISETVQQANRSLREAVSATEQKVRDFGALVNVAQKEAEEAVVSTAAAVRGVAVGAKTAAASRSAGAAETSKPKNGGRPRLKPRRKNAD